MVENKNAQLQKELQQPNGRLISDILAEHYLECDKQFTTLSSITPIKKVVEGAMIEIKPEDVEVGMHIVVRGSRNDLMKQEMVVNAICHENGVFVFESENMVVSDVNFSNELKNLRHEKNYQTPTEIALEMQSQAIAERCISKKKDLMHLYPDTLSVENIFGENIHDIRAGQLVKLDSRIIRMEDINRNVGHGWQMDARGHEFYDGFDGKIYKSVFVQDAVKLEPSGDWIIETPSAIYTTLSFCDKWTEMLREEDLIMKRDLVDNVSNEHNHWFRPNTAELIKMCYPNNQKEVNAWIKDSAILNAVSTNIRNMSLDDFSWYKVEDIVTQSIQDVEKNREQEFKQSLINSCLQSEKDMLFFKGYVGDLSTSWGARISPHGTFQNLTNGEIGFKTIDFDEMRVKHGCRDDDGHWFIETDKMILTNMRDVAEGYFEKQNEIAQSIEESQNLDENEIAIGSRE